MLSFNSLKVLTGNTDHTQVQTACVNTDCMKIAHPQNIMTTSGVFKASLVLKNSLDLWSPQNAAINQGALLKPSNTEKKGFIFQSQNNYSEVGWKKYSTTGFLREETLLSFVQNFLCCLGESAPLAKVDY